MSKTKQLPGQPRKSRMVAKRSSSVFLFDRGSAILRTSEMRKIPLLAARLRRNPDAILVIRGFTLGRGGNDYNRSLGQRRAQAVAGELLRRGVVARRIVALSAGRNRYYEALMPAERQNRRRAEVSLLSNDVTTMPYPPLLMEVQLGRRRAA